MSGFGGAVKLTGESEYRQALKKITQSLKEVSSEMKLVSSSYDKNDKSVKALTAKQEALTNKLDQQKNKLSMIKTAYADMSSQYAENKTKHEALVAEYDKENKKLEEIGKELGTDSKEYQEQAKVVDSLAKEVEESTKAQDANEKALSNMRIEMNKSQADINKTEREMEKLDTELEEAVRAEKNAANGADSMGKAMKNTKTATDQADRGFTVLKGTLANLAAEGITRVVDGLKTLSRTAIETWKEYDAGTDIIVAKTGATGQAAEQLEGVFSNLSSKVVASYDEIGTAVGEVNTRFGVNGQELEDLSEEYLKFAKLNGTDVNSAIDSTQSAMAAFGIQTKDTSKFLDTLNAAGQATGVSVDKLSDLMKTNAPALKEMGLNASDAAMFIAQLDKSGVDVSSTMTGMKKALANAAKEGKPMDQAMQEMEDSIKNASSSTEAITLATELFGSKAGASIATAVREGKLSFAELGTSMEDFEGSVDKTFEATLDGPEKFSLAMQGIKANVGTMMGDLMDKLAPQIDSAMKTLSSAVDKTFKFINKGIDFFLKNGDMIVTVLESITAGVAAYVAYSTALKVMREGWMAISIVEKAVAAGQWAINTAMSANPIGLIIAGVVALVAAFVILWKKSDKFRKFWKNLWKNIKKVAEPVINGIKKAFITAWDMIKKVWDKAVAFFKGVWNGIKLIFSGVVTYYKTIFTLAWKAITTIWNKAVEFFKGIWDGIKKVFTGVSTFFKDKFKGASKAIKSAFSGIATWFGERWTAIKNKFKNVKTFFSDKFKGAVDSIKKKFTALPKFFGGIWEKIKEKFSGLGTKIGDAIGGAVKTGINGIISGAEKVINKAIGLINGAIDLANKLPGVNVGHVGKVKFNRLAQGGVLEKGQIGLLEGSGAEAVVPLEKNTKWIRRVAEEMQTAVSLNRKTQASATATALQYDNVVDAFKSALAEMEIVLDDEKAGKFVEKTVTRIIYA